MLRTTVPLFIFALAASAPAVAQENVPVAGFRSVELKAGGDVSIVPGPVQRVTLLNGSREFTRLRMRDGGTLEIATSCSNHCPRQYNLRIRIESPMVPDVAVEAGGTIRVAPGFAPQRNVSAAINAGGTIDLGSVAVDGASTAINAGGDIFVRPRSSLNVAINAGGEVHYAGNPRLSTAIVNGGSLTRLR
jgi:hypothetical protein